MENKEFENSKANEKFDIVTTNKKYKSQRFKKKKRGIAGFFQKLGDWFKARKWWQKTLLITTVVVLILTIVACIAVPMFLDYNYNPITDNPEELGFENIIDEKVVNIALFGLDTRDENSFKGNSDSMMILSLNTETKKIKIVSIMRDSLVKIEKNGKTYYQKMNSAYASGGPELAIKTINRNFGLDISEYATVNFYGMAEIIDAVGGIDIELTKQEVSTNHKDGFNGLVKRHCKKLGIDPKPYYITTAGKHHVNGIQAVAYSRIRKFVNIWGTNNDFGRTDRQRFVMEQLFNKALTLDKSKYLGLAKALMPYTETSLSLSEIMGLAFDILLESPKFEQTRMPLNEYQMKAPSIPKVGSTVYYDLDFAKDLLHAFFYQDISPEEYVKINGIGKNDWYRNMFGESQGPVEDNIKPNDDDDEDGEDLTESDFVDSSSTDSTGSEDTTSSDVSSGSSSDDTTTSSNATSSGTSSGSSSDVSGTSSGGSSVSQEGDSSQASTQ
ncbi:MAG: LytR family transcriptional regulator [Ruminococcaceae bacterium]|nr:LytR family transcriptional regulator [Oscillospiraceae bacterium]